ncbi:hypothetical protein [Aestuariivirga sp.]|uniref:hypothetical protein n=1 Tax=Aestuariivirga sp. TaxID=2650926 RepID=UPI0039191029
MTSVNDNIRVVIPLSNRRRNGRPKILPPEDILEQQVRVQTPHILRALGRAWAWRRKLESGEVATAGELAKMEFVTERFVSRTMRLSYLAPQVLEILIEKRIPPSLKLPELIATTLLSWAEQQNQVFSEGSNRMREHG